MKDTLIIYRDNTAELVNQDRLQYLLGIKNIRKQIFTFIANVNAKKLAEFQFDYGFEMVA